MQYYLHSFFKAGTDGDPPEARPDTVGCMPVIDWHVNRYGARQALRVTIPGDPRSFEYEIDLEPGNRFYIVENDPEKVQVPNGPIVWRWDEIRQDVATKKEAA